MRLAQEFPGEIFLGRTLALEPVRRLSGGSAALDRVLGGGWPRGRLSEVVGPLSSGKTSLLSALLAHATRRGEMTACIDVADALHPESLVIAGADLTRVLWVRPPDVTDAARCAELVVQAGGFAAVVLDFGAESPRRLRAHVWPRLARAAERSHTVLVVSAPYRLAGSFAALSLSLRAQRACWLPGLWPLFDGFQAAATLTRTKIGRPGASASVRILGR